ncbi:MAG: hypothetical protein M3115_03935 [Thermoproteota archaeon]|nr:hypothetical protein [Thermoproteota archaeon]
MADRDAVCYIFKIQKDDVELQLYVQRILYVSIKRNWLPNLKLLFVKKATFIGSGIIDKFVSFGQLGEEEKLRCFQNNCYGKIEFDRLVRLYPAVALSDTPIEGQNILSIHGARIPCSVALQIEQLARARLIT